jgi:hypothetical protein
MLNPITDVLTPEQRRKEVATILARGILRLGKSRPQFPESTESRLTENSLETEQNGLELSATSRPPVTPG